MKGPNGVDSSIVSSESRQVDGMGSESEGGRSGGELARWWRWLRGMGNRRGGTRRFEVDG